MCQCRLCTNVGPIESRLVQYVSKSMNSLEKKTYKNDRKNDCDEYWRLSVVAGVAGVVVVLGPTMVVALSSPLRSAKFRALSIRTKT